MRIWLICEKMILSTSAQWSEFSGPFSLPGDERNEVMLKLTVTTATPHSWTEPSTPLSYLHHSWHLNRDTLRYKIIPPSIILHQMLEPSTSPGGKTEDKNLQRSALKGLLERWEPTWNVHKACWMMLITLALGWQALIALKCSLIWTQKPFYSNAEGGSSDAGMTLSCCVPGCKFQKQNVGNLTNCHYFTSSRIDQQLIIWFSL